MILKQINIPATARSKYYKAYGNILVSDNNSNNINSSSGGTYLITTDDITTSSNNNTYSSLRIDQDFFRKDNVIKNVDTTTATDNNVFSALNVHNKFTSVNNRINDVEGDIITLSQITETKLSKENDDTAKGHIVFENGITVKSKFPISEISEDIVEESEEEVIFPIPMARAARMMIEIGRAHV